MQQQSKMWVSQWHPHSEVLSYVGLSIVFWLSYCSQKLIRKKKEKKNETKYTVSDISHILENIAFEIVFVVLKFPDTCTVSHRSFHTSRHFIVALERTSQIPIGVSDTFISFLAIPTRYADSSIIGGVEMALNYTEQLKLPNKRVK